VNQADRYPPVVLVTKGIAVCAHCGSRQGAIAELMDQHDAITELCAEVRLLIAQGDEFGARAQMDSLMGVLLPHVAWEEEGLFARIIAQGDFAEEVADLEAEHAKLYVLLADADTDRRGWAAPILDVLEDLDAHVYRENFGLFPAAIAVLDAADWKAIVAARPRDRQVAVSGAHID
jgi:hypothetical protein